jgi:hypothetical protein
MIVLILIADCKLFALSSLHILMRINTMMLIVVLLYTSIRHFVLAGKEEIE